MAVAAINPDRKAYDYIYLEQFVHNEIEFHTIQGEHLFGFLRSFTQETGIFHFAALKKANGDFWSIKSDYTYKDFVGQFISTANVDLKLVSNPGQAKKDDELRRDLEYKDDELVDPNNIDIGSIVINDPDNDPKPVGIPVGNQLRYSCVDFDFKLNQEDFESVVSNKVERYSSTTAVGFVRALEIISTRQLIALTLLPDFSEDRDEPIEFILIGCDQGTYIFPARNSIVNRLKPILESQDICKVIHDSCISLARMFKNFQIDVENVDDTLVLDAELVMRHAKPTGRRLRHLEARSYRDCVAHYLNIKIPWANRDFYVKVGKDKLIANEIDETGLSYARSLVMLLSELRLELLKHIFFPSLVKQFSYSNCVKHASAQEYHSLKTNKLISPYTLVDPDLVNPESVGFSCVNTISQLLIKKFHFFNTIKRKPTASIGVQTEPVKLASPHPSYRRVLRDSYPLASPSQSSSFSPLNSIETKSVSTTDSDSSNEFTIITHGESTMVDSTSENDTNQTNGTDYVDWAKITRMIPDRASSSRIVPAGANY